MKQEISVVGIDLAKNVCNRSGYSVMASLR